MKTIATCNNVTIQTKGKRWFVVEVVKTPTWVDNIYEMNKNSAHLIFNDFLGQVISGKKNCKINLELKDK